MVSFCREKSLLCLVATVLPFYCRSPLSLVPQSTSITWEPTASRRRPAFSSHLLTAVSVNNLAVLGKETLKFGGDAPWIALVAWSVVVKTVKMHPSAIGQSSLQCIQ